MEESNPIVSTFENGLSQAFIPSAQAPGTYPFMLNGQPDFFGGKTTGVGKEQSIELHIELPEGLKVIDYYSQASHNRIITFGFYPKEGYSELGYADLATKTYVRVIDDKDEKFKGKFHFECNRDIDAEMKSQKMRDGCFHSILYFSSANTYYRMDLDGSFCDRTIDEFFLFQCYCVGEAKGIVIKNGGEELKDATYRIFTSLLDSDGNQTNYFRLGDFIHIWGKKGQPGEITKNAIEINIKGSKTTYDRIIIAVARTVNHVTTMYRLETLPYSEHDITYLYQGGEEKEELDPSIVLDKKDGFIKGAGMFQKDRILVLYRLQPYFNVDIQKYVANAKLYWVDALIDFEDADKYRTFPRGELVSPALILNFCDGTTSAAFPLYGRRANDYDREKIPVGQDGNCTECELERWQVENTAFVTKKFCTPVPSSLSSSSSQQERTSEPYLRWVKFNDVENQGIDGGRSVTSSPNDMYRGWLSVAGGCIQCGSPEKVSLNIPCQGCTGASDKSGSCGGQQCAGGGCYGGQGCPSVLLTSNILGVTPPPQASDPEIDKCTLRITYYKANFNCPYCDQLEAANTLPRAQDILGVDYTVDPLTIIDSGETPCNFYPCIKVQCGDNTYTYGWQEFITDDALKNTINFACPCGDNTGVDPGTGTGGGGCGSGGSGGGGCSGSGKNCNDCAKEKCLGPIYSGARCGEIINTGKFRSSITTGKYVCNTSTCSKPDQWSDDGICAECNNVGQFHMTNGGQEYRLERFAEKRILVNEPKVAFDSDVPNCPGGEPIYDASGCRIIGKKPVIVQEGEFGYFESLDTYPEIKNCNGDYLYGEDKGAPIRYPMFPDENLVPYHVTNQEGVVSDAMPENQEWGKTKLRILGAKLVGFSLPQEVIDSLPKPLCPMNPVSVVMQPIGARIVAKGLLTHTFKGKIGNQEYAVQKNAVNALELYDRHIDVVTGAPVDHFRGGENINAPIYTFHSPDTNFREIPLRVDKVQVPWEVFGTGRRYDTYAEGERVKGIFDSGLLHKGARQSINLNKYKLLEDRNVCCDQVNATISQFLAGVEVTKSNVLEVNSSILLVGLRVDTSTTQVTRKIIVEDLSTGLYLEDDNLDVFLGAVFALKSTLTLAKAITDKTTVTVEYTFKVNSGVCVHEGGITIVSKYLILGNASDISTRTTALISSDCIPTKNNQIRCLKEISYVGTDSVLQTKGDFTYPLLNKGREKTVYLELGGNEYKLTNSIDQFLTDGQYNGFGNTTANNTCDGSFLGDLECRSCKIYNAAGHWAILINDNPKPYGRLENAIFHPIGFDLTWEEFKGNKATRVGIGNKWMGMYTHRRFSVPSDKVGSLDDQRRPTVQKLTLIDWDLGIFGNILVEIDIAALLCLYTCVKIPINCNADPDPRKNRGLRSFGRRCWDGLTRFVGKTNVDTYHSNAQNTLIHMICESSVQLQHRKIGVCDFIRKDVITEEINMNKAEVHYPNLECLQLDPEFQKGTSWTKAFLTRYGYKWPKTPMIMRVIKTILKIALLYLVSKWVIETFDDVVLDLYFTTVPVGMFLIIAWFLFILFKADFNYIICDVLDALLDIQECVFECYNADGQNCKIADGDLLPIEENYTEYNWDHSRENNIETFIAPGASYDTCKCTSLSNHWVFSDPQALDSINDAWQNFRVNNFSELPMKYGVTLDLFEDGGKVIAHTSVTYMVIESRQQTLKTGEGSEIIIGTGNFLNIAIPPYGGAEEGFAGCMDAYASMTSKYGHLFVDRGYPGIYKFQGGPKEMTDGHIYHFIKEHLGFEILKQFPEFDQIGAGYDSVGYAIGVDPRLNRMLITKRDFKAIKPDMIRFDGAKFILKKTGEPISVTDSKHFIDVSFTASYDLASQKWIGFHSYTPYLYITGRSHMYSIGEKGIYIHSEAKSFLNQYGKVVPWIVDVIQRHPHGSDFLIDQVTIDTESIGYVNGQPFRKDIFFDEIGAYNSYQSTGMKRVKIIEDIDPQEVKGVIKVLKLRKQYKLAALTDNVGVKHVPMTSSNQTESSIFNDLDKNIITANNNKTDRFTDDYVVYRLICSGKGTEDINLILKSIITSWQNV